MSDNNYPENGYDNNYTNDYTKDYSNDGSQDNDMSNQTTPGNSSGSYHMNDTNMNSDSYNASGRYRHNSTSASYDDNQHGSYQFDYRYSNIYDSDYNQKPRKKKKRGGSVKYIGKIIASALVFGIVAGATMTGISVAKDHFLPSNLANVQVATASTEDTSAEGSKTNAITTTDVSGIVDQVMPSVVSITCTVQSTNFFYGTRESQGAGSGFIIAKNNKSLYIATNNHVVNGATSLTVGFADGTSASAQVVGTDADADLAVISVKEEDISEETTKNIKIAILGDSDALKVGEPVIAIGNALGYGQSVTTGVVSAKDREVSFTDGTLVLLQTDAAINPGNSGGVLINHAGQVIGINNAKLSDTSVEGMGYAIPMTTAKDILTDLMNASTVKEGDQSYLGIVGKNIDAQYSEALGIPAGIYVSQVPTGSPAEAAGISAGDVITGIDGANVSTMTGLKDKLARKKSGDKVEISLKRANQNGEYEDQKITVTLGKKSDFIDASEDVDNNPNGNNDNGNNGNYRNPFQPYGNDDEDDSYGNGYIDPFEYFFGNGGGSFFFNH